MTPRARDSPRDVEGSGSSSSDWGGCDEEPPVRGYNLSYSPSLIKILFECQNHNFVIKDCKSEKHIFIAVNLINISNLVHKFSF